LKNKIFLLKGWDTPGKTIIKSKLLNGLNFKLAANASLNLKKINQ